MKLAIITAVAKNGALGNDGQIPWHFPEDMKRFRNLTVGKIVIMGRKTFESIGRALPNRLNIVVTRQPDYEGKALGCTVARSLEEALEFAKQAIASIKPAANENEEVCCIGGAEIYRLAMPIADKIYLTRIEREFEGDTFFPPIDMSVWRCVYVASTGWHGKETEKFLAYFLEFDRSKAVFVEK